VAPTLLSRHFPEFPRRSPPLNIETSTFILRQTKEIESSLPGWTPQIEIRLSQWEENQVSDDLICLFLLSFFSNPFSEEFDTGATESLSARRIPPGKDFKMGFGENYSSWRHVLKKGELNRPSPYNDVIQRERKGILLVIRGSSSSRFDRSSVQNFPPRGQEFPVQCGDEDLSMK